MTNEILITTELQNHGNWIRIFIPYSAKNKMMAILQNDHGEVLKAVSLAEGNNSIDISNIKNTSVNIKIETPYETILKKLNLSSE
jgi:hypothetical protein